MELYTINLVKEFHEVFGHPISDVPQLMISSDLKRLRYKLMKEEYEEYLIAGGALDISLPKETLEKNINRVEILDALCDLQYVISGAVLVHGFQRGWSTLCVSLKTYDVKVEYGGYNFDHILDMYMGSIDYVAPYILANLQVRLDSMIIKQGFMHVFEQAFKEVHRSNMSKLGEDGKPVYRKDGKVLKGANYTPPNLIPFVETVYGFQNT